MELHESLHELGSRLGEGLFSDADNFRGALDDYVDETSASTGDINLLVDAVRLGAFQSMKRMLDSGAPADSAITEAGARLARDRGSSEAAGPMWACAVLGYAIDQVSEPQVRQYAAQRSTRQPPPPVMGGAPVVSPLAPQGPPVASPPTSPPAPYQSPHQAPPPPYQSPAPQQPPPPAWPSSGGVAAQSSADRTAMAGAAGASSFDRATNPKQAPPPAGPPVAAMPGGGPREQRKVWPIVAVAAAVLLVLGIGIPTAIVLTDGGGEDGPATETVALSTVDETYAELGESVSAGAEECVVGKRVEGETEAIECTGEDGTLRLVTYDSENDLDAARDELVSTSKGSILIEEQQGTFYSFDPAVAESDEPASVYWDNDAAAQAATYHAAEELDDPASALLTSFEETSPSIDGPDEVVDSDLSAFLQTFNVSGCDRVPNQYDAMTESDECQLEGYDVHVGQFEEKPDFNRNRRQYREAANEAGCRTRFSDNSSECANDLWFTNLDGKDGYHPQSGDVERGRIWAHTEAGSGVVYAERIDCLCYLVMVGDGESADKVTKILGNQLGG